ncbi:hypothetical protein GBAR_LOCUS23904, partial [Geodia barretti]
MSAVTLGSSRKSVITSTVALSPVPTSSRVKFMSLEKEVFPFMAQDGQLFAFDLEALITAESPSWWRELEPKQWERHVHTCLEVIMESVI